MTGAWVTRGPLNAPTIDFICIERVRIEGEAGADGYDMMEFMVVDASTDPDGKPISHMFRLSMGMGMLLSNAIVAWVNEEPPEWQQGHRHIHVTRTSGNHETGTGEAFWVPPDEVDERFGEDGHGR